MAQHLASNPVNTQQSLTQTSRNVSLWLLSHFDRGNKRHRSKPPAVCGTSNIASGAKIFKIDILCAEKSVKLDQQQQLFVSIQKKGPDKVTKTRRRQINAHNRRANTIYLNFSVGEFVVVQWPKKLDRSYGFFGLLPTKSFAKKPLVYKVAHLDWSDFDIVQCARLQLYRACRESKPVWKNWWTFAERTEARYELIHNIVDIGEDRNGIFLQVQWLGLPDEWYWKWVPLADLYSDVLDTVMEFFRSQMTKRTLLLRSMKDIGLYNWHCTRTEKLRGRIDTTLFMCHAKQLTVWIQISTNRTHWYSPFLNWVRIIPNIVLYHTRVI